MTVSTSLCYYGTDLTFIISGETFKKLADTVMRHALHKGVPPLFVNLRSLYNDPEKVSLKVLEILINGLFLPVLAIFNTWIHFVNKSNCK